MMMTIILNPSYVISQPWVSSSKFITDQNSLLNYIKIEIQDTNNHPYPHLLPRLILLKYNPPVMILNFSSLGFSGMQSNLSKPVSLTDLSSYAMKPMQPDQLGLSTVSPRETWWSFGGTLSAPSRAGVWVLAGILCILSLCLPDLSHPRTKWPPCSCRAAWPSLPHLHLVGRCVIAPPAQDDQLRVFILLAHPLLCEGQQGPLPGQVEQGRDSVGIGSRLEYSLLLQDGASGHGAWGRAGERR